nr:hypothetical protein [uncultured Cohaesibacter sp.]
MSDWVIKGYDSTEEFYSRSFERLEKGEIEHLLTKLYLQTLPIGELATATKNEDVAFIITHPDAVGETLQIGNNLHFVARKVTH